VRLAGSGVAEGDDRLPGVDPRTGGEGGQGCGDAGDDVSVEVSQPLEPGEAGSPMRRARRRLALSSISADRISAR
jgi:hypothetical protein